MEPPAEICENYQLKWSSYTSYIHSCIASSLVTEDSFADVALVTMDGHKIMAHRFVLSYASQYFNKALKFHPKVTTALPLMIVLPQSITYKALKILVKYMYSGEATVTKDILNVVLKAGDILKIKGLYREDQADEQGKSPRGSGVKPAAQVPNPESHAQKPKDPKSVVDNQSVSKNPPPLVVSSSVNQKIIQSQNEATKAKEVQKVQQSKLLQNKLQNRLQDKQSPPSTSSNVKQYGGPRVLNFSMTNFNGTIEKENASPKRIILNQKVAQPSDKPHTITSADAESQNSSDSNTVTIKTENGKTDNLSYLVIKDEPLEWTEADMEIVDEKEVFPEESVKTESYDSTSNEGGNGNETTTDQIINLENEFTRQFNIDGLPRSVDLNTSEREFTEDIAELIDIPALIVKEPNSTKLDDADKTGHIQEVEPEPDAENVESAVNDKDIAAHNAEDTAHDIEHATDDDGDVVFVAESLAAETQQPAAVFEDEDITIIDPSATYNIFETSAGLDVNISTGLESYDSDSDSSRPVLQLSELKNFDMVSFIDRDMVGRALLQRASKGILGNTDRDRLADLVVTHFTNKYGNLNMKQLKVLAKRFEQIPNEKSTTYFVDPIGKGKSAKGKSEPARGKLMDKSRNRLHLIRATLGLVKSKKYASNEALVDPNIPRGRDLRDILNDTSDNDTVMELPPLKKRKLSDNIDTSVMDEFDYHTELRNFDIIGFINQDLLGQALLKRAHRNILNNSDRDRLADLIVTHFMNRFDGHLEINQLKTLAKLLELHVPFEKSITYFIDPVHKDRSKKGKSEPARGKLTDKYRNLKHLIKTMSGQVKKLKGPNADLDDSDSLTSFPETARDSQIWLKTNTEPESEVYKHWQDSSVIRRNVESEVSTVFDEWPILKTMLALPLVSCDFESICKMGEEFNMESAFNALFTTVCNSRLFTLNSADHAIFDLLQENLTTGSTSASEIYTPLTCELCTETFTIPGEWVKHVQTHTDMLPAKRRRRDSPDIEPIYETGEEAIGTTDDLYENFAEILGNMPEDHESTELRNLLKTWGQEKLANHLIDQNVFIPVLKMIKRHHIERLLKNFDMGTQILFEYNLESWRATMELPFDNNKIGDSSSLSNHLTSLTSHVLPEESSSPQIVPFPKPSTVSDEYIPLANILKESPKGLMLTEYYKKFNKFHDEQRILLVALIASYYEEKAVALTLSVSHRLELEVLEQFSTEKLEYYRIGKRGKIYNKYSNMKSSFKSAVSSHVAQVPSKTTKNKEKSSRHEKEFEPEADAESCLQCLKYENLSVEEFDQYWKGCSRYRLSQIKELESTSSILETWPYYKTPSGYLLIDMDFKMCFDDRDGLVLNWDKYAEQLISFLSRNGHVKDKRIKALIETLRNTPILLENGRNAAIFWSLHGYFVPTKLLVTRKENKRSSTRFTIRDSQESFLYIGGSIQEIEDHIIQIKSSKPYIQPFVYCVGEDIFNLRDIWVYFDDIRYHFDNFVRAVDTCFKIMCLFNIDFPPESLTFYSFLESFFYNFKSKNVTTRIHVLSESLKNENESGENKK